MPPSFFLQLWRAAMTARQLREYCTTWGQRSWCARRCACHRKVLMACIWQAILLQVEVIKKAYMQGEIEVEEPEEGEDGEEEHSASPRNVGHNIYILAHQVRHRCFVKSVTLLLLYVLVISCGRLRHVKGTISHSPPCFSSQAVNSSIEDPILKSCIAYKNPKHSESRRLHQIIALPP